MKRISPMSARGARIRDHLILSLGLLVSLTGFFGQEIPWLLAAL